MSRTAAIVLALGAMILAAPAALACEGGYKAHYADELKQLRDTLADPGADPFDRLIAFEELVCSERAVVRAWATRTGLETAEDDMVRHQVLLDAVMQLPRLDVEYPALEGLSRPDREFANAAGGFTAFDITYRNRSEGCLSLLDRRRCRPDFALFVQGDKATLNHRGLVGEFRLADGGVLRGFVRQGNAPENGRIPAVIRLF